MWLREREWCAELLDNAGLNEAEVYNALAGLQRLNFISRGAGVLWPEIRKLARARRLRHVRVLDLACGGGDIPLALMRKARKSNFALALAACDLNPRSLEYARGRAHAAGQAITFFALDVLRQPLPQGYDVVMCSLFLHHLKESEAAALLGRMAGAAQHLVLVNDLQRNWLNGVLVWLGSRLLSRSHVVHTDALRSVKNAFTPSEFAALAHSAGLTDFSIKRHWPARMLLRWKKS